MCHSDVCYDKVTGTDVLAVVLNYELLFITVMTSAASAININHAVQSA